jgi:SWI/SNF-related matrix-associated actin-dependent regulator of chromatin subfamily A member 5
MRWVLVCPPSSLSLPSSSSSYSLSCSPHVLPSVSVGKTLQSISMLGYLSEYKNIVGPHLVVVPKSTLSNWMNEFQRWCPTLRPLRFHGNKEERAEFIQTHLRPAVTSKSNSARDWDILITTYEIFNSEKTILAKIAWRFIIIDEANRLKNEASLFSTNIRLLTTEHRLLLTGTPLQNNLHELWALLNFLLPEIFTSSEQFDEWFNLDVDDQEAKQRMINQLHKILRPFMLRRLKIDVEKTLPPKTETILFTGLSITQKNVYRQLLLRDIDQINTNFGNNSNSTSNATRTAILNIVMQLRKCCNHPYLFPGVEDRNENPYGEHLINNCGKMVLLDKLLKKLYERKHRVLIFSQMTRMLDILEDYCSMREFHYCRIDGNTSYDDREDRIAEYNSLNSQKFIFLLSTRAGGLGINLQTADTVIIYDSDWNPQADLQAQDRCHRIGQTKQVHVYRLVTDDTVEVKVVERAQQKLKLDAMVVQQGRLADSNRDTSKKMSKNELLETLKFGADKIFRTKDSSSITDEDIDIILEMGRKRTEELNEKLQIADKGDLYDFRLDGGSSGVGGGGGSSGIQIFEGKDYSDKSLRDGHGHGHGLNFIDTGPRERKTLGSYNDSLSSKTSKGGGGGGDGDDKKQIKLPRHLRLPKMEDWQFYSRERLIELQEMEVKLFEALVERGETPPPGTLGKLILLSDELQEEKLKLLSEAFGDWNKNHFNNFIKASAKYGRKQFQKISEEVGRPVDDILKYDAPSLSPSSSLTPSPPPLTLVWSGAIDTLLSFGQEAQPRSLLLSGKKSSKLWRRFISSSRASLSCSLFPCG